MPTKRLYVIKHVLDDAGWLGTKVAFYVPVGFVVSNWPTFEVPRLPRLSLEHPERQVLATGPWIVSRNRRLRMDRPSPINPSIRKVGMPIHPGFLCSLLMSLEVRGRKW